MPVRRGSRVRKVVLGLVPIAAVLTLWQLSADLGWVRSDNWPPVTRVVASLVSEMWAGELPLALGQTGLLVAAGFLVGSAVGVVAASLAALRGEARAVLVTLVEVLRPIPVPALVPPLVLLFGTEFEMKLVVVAASVLFPVFVNTLAGFASLDPQLRLVARTHGLGEAAFLRDILLPTALPGMFSGLRIGLGVALVVAVTAEIIVGGSGIGHYLTMMQFAARPAEMYGAVLALLACAWAANLPLQRLERVCVFWRADAR